MRADISYANEDVDENEDPARMNIKTWKWTQLQLIRR